MNKLATKALAVAFTCLTAASAAAGPVLIKETSLGNGMGSGGLVLPILANPANYWAGLQNIRIDNTQNFLAFCVDPWEWSPGSNQSYNTNNLDSIFGATKAGNIRELYSEAYASTLIPGNQGGNLNAAAFQLALWEIIADNQLNLALGAVHTVASTNGALATAAQNLLNQIDGNFGNENYVYQFYTSGNSAGARGTAGYQDYLVVNRVPEPGTALLLLSALCSASLIGRRRRKQAEARLSAS